MGGASAVFVVALLEMSAVGETEGSAMGICDEEGDEAGSVQGGAGGSTGASLVRAGSAGTSEAAPAGSGWF